MRKRGLLRALAPTAAVIGAVTGIAAPAQAAPAQADSCNVIHIGTSAGIWMNGEHVGDVEQQYDNCRHARAHWHWDDYYRTHAHAGTTGAWITPSLLGRNTGQIIDGPRRGSLDGTDAYTNWVGIYQGGEDTCLTRGGLYTTWTNGSTNSCGALTDAHNYTTGGSITPAYPNRCTH